MTAQAAIRNYPNLTTAPLDFDTAVEVAHVRAATKLKMPDAIVLGTAIAHQVEVIVHGDDEWEKKAKPYAATLTLVNIGDHCGTLKEATLRRMDPRAATSRTG
jgi:hypothetical protein